MPAKTTAVEVRLPAELVAQLKSVAKLAGLSVESVIKLVLAAHVYQQQNEPGSTGTPGAEIVHEVEGQWSDSDD